MAEQAYKPKFIGPTEQGKIRGDVVTLYEIKVNGNTIGNIQNIAPSERRDIYETWGIGSQETHPVPDELIPGLVKSKTLSCDRVAFYDQNVIQAFGYDSLNLIDAEEPFEIEEYKFNPALGESGAMELYRTYVDCIISDFSSTRTITGDIRIIDKVTIHYRDVVIGSGYPRKINKKSSE